MITAQRNLARCLLLLTCLLATACYAETDAPIGAAGGASPVGDAVPREDGRGRSTNGESEPTTPGTDPAPLEPGPEPLPEDQDGMLAEVDDVVLLRADERHAYWLEAGTRDALGNHLGDGALVRFDLVTFEAQTLVGGLREPAELFLDDARIYFVADGDDGTPTLQSVDKSEPGEPALLAPVRGYAHFAQDADRIYFLTPESGTSTYGLFSVPKGGGDVVQVTSGEPEGSALAVHDGRVLLHRDDAIVAVPLAGGEPEVLLDGVYYADELLVADGQLLITSWMDGTLTRVALDGGAPTVLVRTEDDRPPLAIEAGDPYVYYAYVSSDGVRQIARTGLTPGSDQVLRVVGTQSPDALGTHDVLFAVSGDHLLFVHEGAVRLFGLQP